MIRVIQHTDFLHDHAIRPITLGVVAYMEEAWQRWGKYKVMYYCACRDFEFIGA